MATSIPSHVGIIMDGNGRWAVRNNLLRAKGHSEGVRAAKRCVEAALACGITYLSLYVFSTENWARTKEETDFLLALIAENLRKEELFYIKHGVRVMHSGSKEEMPEHIVREIAWVEERTKAFKNITVNLAINYGGQDEIVRAVNRFYQAQEHRTPITSQDIDNYLDIAPLPYPDLIIRTGGEFRLSNFLLWESAYAELYFSDKLWPDWQQEDLEIALHEFSARNRSFGGKKTRHED